MADATHLAEAFGLRRNRRGWSGNCPSCGYAGTFTVNQREGRALWWCASCQDRDGLLAAVRSVAGGDWTPPEAAAAAPPKDNAARTRAALAIWT